MFYIRSALTNIRRYKSKSILNLLICIMLVMLLNLFLGSLQSNKQQLEDMSKAVSIFAQISNLNGSLQTGLVIREPVIDGILQSEYISKPSITVVLSAGEGDLQEKDLRSHKTMDAAGITRIEAVSGLTEEDVTLMPDTSLDILQSDKPVCILEEGILSQKNWKIGQTIKLSLYYDYRDYNYQYITQKLTTDEFLIAGSVMSKDGIAIPQILVPFAWAKKTFHQENITFLANSLSFYLKDPLQLNKFKKEMHDELNLLEIIPASDFAYAGNALAVSDETFILSASRVQDNIRMLGSFLPFVLIIVILIGYITSYLLIQNRKGQYATMRSLGVSSRMCLITLLLESILIELAGGAIGIIVSVLFIEHNVIIPILTFAVFFFCYICGTSAALYQLGKVSVMKALAQKD